MPDRIICNRPDGIKCMCDPHESVCWRIPDLYNPQKEDRDSLRAYSTGKTDAAPVPMYERGD